VPFTSSRVHTVPTHLYFGITGAGLQLAASQDRNVPFTSSRVHTVPTHLNFGTDGGGVGPQGMFEPKHTDGVSQSLQ
jgi:hypothetical protein